MMEAARAGGNRQELHETIRSAAMESWGALSRGEANPLGRLLTEDHELTTLLDPAEIRLLLDPSKHIGTASERAQELATRLGAVAPFPVQPEVRIS